MWSFLLLIFIIYILLLVSIKYNEMLIVLLWSLPPVIISIFPIFFVIQRFLQGVSIYYIVYPYNSISFYIILFLYFIFNGLLFLLLFNNLLKLLLFKKQKFISYFKMHVFLYSLMFSQFMNKFWQYLEILYCRLPFLRRFFNLSFFIFIRQKKLNYLKNIILFFLYFGLFLNVFVSFIEIVILQQVFYTYYCLGFLIIASSFSGNESTTTLPMWIAVR